jgi:hypothetical protein
MNEEILKELKEQTKWLKFLALPSMRKTVEDNLTTKEQKRIYQLTDGVNSTYVIAKKLGAEGMKVSHMTVHNYWKKWFSLGLVIPSKRFSGRSEKVVDLLDLDTK